MVCIYFCYTFALAFTKYRVVVCLVLASFFEKIYIDREVVQEASAVLLCMVDGLKETSFSIFEWCFKLDTLDN